MPDIYSSIQKQKKKPEQDETDKLIAEKCKKLEQENYSTAKLAREKLQKTAQKQKSITDDLQHQGEQLVNAQKSGVNVHRNVREGAATTEKIHEEGHFFRVPLLGSIKRMFKGDRGEDQFVDNQSQESLHAADEEESSSGITRAAARADNKTDKELQSIYNTLKGMKKENTKQQDEMEKQKKVAKSLNALNKDSNVIVSRTNMELKKL
ncbi:hypothetical protein EQH57_0553 [Dictyocoela roeselum]|nr:hypothetical protein EQH57_0553 [Dictyocoela roeselum]